MNGKRSYQKVTYSRYVNCIIYKLQRFKEYILARAFQDGPVAQWIRHLTTYQGIPGSNPGGVVHFWMKNLLKRFHILSQLKSHPSLYKNSQSR